MIKLKSLSSWLIESYPSLPAKLMITMLSKEKIWQQIKKGFDKTLGKSLDYGIKETVIVLNALGFKTSMSCEGHLGHGSRAPWVHLDIKNADYLEKLLQDASDKADQASPDRTKPMTSQARELWKKYHKLRLQIKKKQIKLAQKLIKLLDEFYENRNVTYDTRLTLHLLGPTACRLESEAADLQEALPLKVCQRNLLKYQEEMRAFTTFLKDKYFSR